nr:alcohol dehydrogenase-like 1 [Ipomoea batatas]
MDPRSPGTITCKGVVAWQKGEALKVEEIQVDPPKSSEVRIKMLFSSVCHTDILSHNGFPIVVAGARDQGAAKIIGIDINEFKREKGKAFGMTDFINPKESEKTVSELVKDITEGLGADYGFECTGVASLLNEAIDATKVGSGTVVAIGAGAGGEKSWDISIASVLLCGRTFKGSIFGGVQVKSDFPSIVDKCIRKEVQLEELLTHEISLEETPSAFELLKQPDCVKVVIKF